jgi:hypothetical protein
MKMEQSVPKHQHVHITYEDGTVCSKMSAHKIQTPRNRPKEWLQQTRGWREKFVDKKWLKMKEAIAFNL